MKKLALIVVMVLLLNACASTRPIQPGDIFYNSKLRVNAPYDVPPSLFLLGFHFQAGDYNAYMQDNNGVYFASPTPILAKDPIAGTVYRTGGLYYAVSQNEVYYYLLSMNGFGGAQKSSKPLYGLNYQVKK